MDVDRTHLIIIGILIVIAVVVVNQMKSNSFTLQKIPKQRNTRYTPSRKRMPMPKQNKSESFLRMSHDITR